MITYMLSMGKLLEASFQSWSIEQIKYVDFIQEVWGSAGGAVAVGSCIGVYNIICVLVTVTVTGDTTLVAVTVVVTNSMAV